MNFGTGTLYTQNRFDNRRHLLEAHDDHDDHDDHDHDHEAEAEAEAEPAAAVVDDEMASMMMMMAPEPEMDLATSRARLAFAPGRSFDAKDSPALLAALGNVGRRRQLLGEEMESEMMMMAPEPEFDLATSRARVNQDPATLSRAELRFGNYLPLLGRSGRKLLDGHSEEAGSASPEQRVQELGLVLDGRLPTNPQGVYHPVVLVGSLAHVSGQIPRLPDGSLMTGIAGDSASEEEAAQAAYEVGVTMLATLKNELGSLDRVKRIVKVNGYVACTPDFERQPAVMNALSNLFIDVFGPAGKSARSAVGVAALPLGITVEAEAIVEVDLE
jgi:enamine deaminase RidA (YjgF/YER057c/UK114 family)